MDTLSATLAYSPFNIGLPASPASNPPPGAPLAAAASKGLRHPAGDDAAMRHDDELREPRSGPSLSADPGGRAVRAALAGEMWKRLAELTRLAVQERESVPAMSSVSGLRQFMDSCKPNRSPLLATDDDGIVVATWRNGNEEMLSVRFLDQEHIHFAWAVERGWFGLSRRWGESGWREFLAGFAHGKRFFG